MKQLEQIGRQLKLQQQRDAERAAEQREREAQAQQILLQAMYASTCEAVTSSMNEESLGGSVGWQDDSANQLCAQLRHSTVKTTLAPVDELREEDGWCSELHHPACTTNDTSPRPSPLLDALPTVSRESALGASLERALSKVGIESQVNQQLPCRRKRRPATGGTERSRGSSRSSKSSGDPLTKQIKRPSTATGYQHTPPKSSDPVADRMRHLLHNQHWSPSKEGEYTKLWSPQRKRW